MFISPLEIMKYNCVKSFLHRELSSAEQERDKCEVVVEDESFIRKHTLDILKIIEEQNCTLSNVKKMATKFPIYFNLYKRMSDVFETHFKVGDDFIPCLFAYEVLNLYKHKGFRDFDEFDFITLQAEFERFLISDKDYRKFISKHFACAYDIVKCMEISSLKKSAKKKSKKSA